MLNTDWNIFYLIQLPMWYFTDGTYITQWIDIDRTCEEISKFSRRDAETYRTMISEWRAVAPFFSKVRYYTRRMDISSRATGFIRPVSHLVTPAGALSLGHHRLLI